MFKKYTVGRKNVDISLLWAAMPSTLRTTALKDYADSSSKNAIRKLG